MLARLVTVGLHAGVCFFSFLENNLMFVFKYDGVF